MSGSYRAAAAHLRAHACRIKPRIEKRLRPGTALWHHVVDCLKAGYSPEQVAGTLATVHPDAPSLQVSRETIYTAIYAMPRGALRTEVIGWLRLAMPNAARGRAAQIGAGKSQTWSAFMIGRQRLRSAWCRDTGGRSDQGGVQMFRGGHAGGACHAIHRAGQAGQCQRRIGREGLRSGAPPDRGPAAPVLDVRSGARNGGTLEIGGRHWDKGVLRRPA